MEPSRSDPAASGTQPEEPCNIALPAPAPLTWRSAAGDDGPLIAELRALVLRASLERLGRYDEVRVRQRFLAEFAPAQTQILSRQGEVVGAIALRPTADGTWVEHFYLQPDLQGQGLGSAVMTALTAAADHEATTLRLNVLQSSDARRLYERHGFTLDREDHIDVYLQRAPNAG